MCFCCHPGQALFRDSGEARRAGTHLLPLMQAARARDGSRIGAAGLPPGGLSGMTWVGLIGLKLVHMVHLPGDCFAFGSQLSLRAGVI